MSRSRTRHSRDAATLHHIQSNTFGGPRVGEGSSKSVKQQLSPHLSRSPTFGVDSPIFIGGMCSHGGKHKDANGGSSAAGCTSKLCPHCGKEYSTAWAVPKHVQRMHDRSGVFHCPRCTFKSPSQAVMSQHEKEAHRTCPYCRQLFVLLNKHIGSCPKRHA